MVGIELLFFFSSVASLFSLMLKKKKKLIWNRNKGEVNLTKKLFMEICAYATKAHMPVEKES